jgi:hypothetical protein
MGIMNEEPVVQSHPDPLWRRILPGVAAVACAILALYFYPPAFEAARELLAPPISSAIASDKGSYISPAEASRQQMSNATTAVHGMFVKDAYGCLYMFQYLSAQLILEPVLNEQKQRVCGR